MLEFAYSTNSGYVPLIIVYGIYKSEECSTVNVLKFRTL